MLVAVEDAKSLINVLRIKVQFFGHVKYSKLMKKKGRHKLTIKFNNDHNLAKYVCLNYYCCTKLVSRKYF